MVQSDPGLAERLLKALPGLMPSLRVASARRAAVSGNGPEVVVEVLTPSRRKRTLHLVLRAVGAPSRIAHVVRDLKQAGKGHRYPVLAAPFLSPRARALCQEEGIGYLDLAGNCRLAFEDFYLERIVDKNPHPPRGRPPTLFSPVSSRLLRVMLEEPGRGWQVSELARVAQVSLGQASNVCRRLMDEGYAARTARRLRLSKPGVLLDAWREAYASMASGPLAAYYSFEQEPERLMARVAEAAASGARRYAMTSFAGASLVAPFVRGVGAVAWYVEPGTPEAWVAALDLRPVEAGPNVLLMAAGDPGVFYRTQTIGGIAVVSNVQLYLDLWRDAGRAREQAEFLRAERLRY